MLSKLAKLPSFRIDCEILRKDRKPPIAAISDKVEGQHHADDRKYQDQRMEFQTGYTEEFQ